MPKRSLLVAAVLAVACGQKSSPAEEQPEVAARTPASDSKSAPAPETKAEPEAKAEPKQAPEPEAAPAFELVARRGETQVAAALLLEAGGPSPYLVSAPQVFVLRSDGGIDHEPKWVQGIELSDPSVDDTANVAWWEGRAIAGAWPDAHMVLVRSGDEIVPPELFARKGDAWSPEALRHDGRDVFAVGLGPWLEGGTLALVTEERDPDAKGTRFVTLGSAAKAPSAPGSPILAFASSDDGEVIAIVASEDATELWAHRAGAAERRAPVPGGGMVERAGVVTTGVEHAWVFGGRQDGSGYLAERKATAWSQVEVDCDGPIPSVSVAADGTPYVVCPKGDDRSLLRRGNDGAWTKVPGAPSKPHTVVAASAEDIWVLAGDTTDPTELWHTGTTVDQPMTLPDASQGVHAGLEWAQAHPVTKTCGRVWIPIAETLTVEAVETKLEPVYDGLFPQVRTTRVQGREQLGVMLPNASDPPGAVARSKRITDRLGADAGEPSCNERPPVDHRG